jgi:helix-turn-helix protein
MQTTTLARAMWTLYEPIHAITYFAAGARVEFEQAGLRGFWRGYFAGRAAPLGPVGPAPVVGLFNSFAPVMVERALPAVWDLISPEEALAARNRGAVVVLADLVDAREAARLGDLLAPIVAAQEPAGHALGAANLALPEPDDPHARLWQACTSLREHRGDGHVAALVAVGVTGADIVVLRCGIDSDRAVHQPARGWSDEEWLAATSRLVRRELLDADGEATEAGRAVVVDAEEITNQAAASPWEVLAPGEVLEVARGLSPLARACRKLVPEVTPIGDLRLWDVENDPEYLHP